MDCRYHEKVHEVILSAPNLGFFYLSNIASECSLDVLMLSLISAISLAVMTTDEMRCHTTHKIKRSCRKLLITKVILGSIGTSLGFRNNNSIESYIIT